VGVFGTIVIGYDGSDRSDAALGLGGALARLTGDDVEVVLAYPVKPLSARVGGGEFQDLSRAEALRRLDGARRRLQDVAVRHLRSAPAGTPAEALHAAARADDAGLIVVAASRQGGSVAERVLRDAPAAVAVAPPWIGSRPRLSRVAVALDGSPHAYAALLYATALAQLPGTPVERLELLSFVAEALAPPWLDDAAAESGGTPVHERDDPLAGLLRRSRGLDLLVIGSRDAGVVRRSLGRRISQGVVRGAECPVLVVPRGVPSPRTAA
jgi:nucleotide-binding universal stress UspA family protein